LVNELTPRAERAQAVNTIAFFKDTSLLGDNTDGLGLTSDLGTQPRHQPRGKRMLILGAGGAVRGVLGPLLERELSEVVIANRTPIEPANWPPSSLTWARSPAAASPTSWARPTT
jgi:shikimate dehydrogenase